MSLFDRNAQKRLTALSDHVTNEALRLAKNVPQDIPPNVADECIDVLNEAIAANDRHVAAMRRLRMALRHQRDGHDPAKALRALATFVIAYTTAMLCIAFVIRIAYGDASTMQYLDTALRILGLGTLAGACRVWWQAR